jgi:hypothetical protein
MAETGSDKSITYIIIVVKVALAFGLGLAGPPLTTSRVRPDTAQLIVGIEFRLPSRRLGSEPSGGDGA